MHTTFPNSFPPSARLSESGCGEPLSWAAPIQRSGGLGGLKVLKVISVGLMLAMLMVPWSSVLADNTHTYCHDEVCIDFSPVGSYHVLTVTDVETSEPWLVQLTGIPSDLQPSHSPPGGDTQPPVDPSLNKAGGKETLAHAGPQVPPGKSYEFLFSSSHGVWVVVTTLVFGPDSELVDVNAHVTHLPHQHQVGLSK